MKRPSFQTLSLVLCAAGVFGMTAAFLRSMERRALECRGIRDQIDAAGRLRPAADIARSVRAMKLVTVEIDTSATAQRDHESWRGDVSASVKAPVRLLFGTDLSRMQTDSVALSPLTHTYHVRIPPPERIATEIDTGIEEAEVRVGWARLRTMAGEYWLGQARRGLSEEARRLMLSRADAETVRRQTLEQVESLVQRLVGPDARVNIVFDDGLPLAPDPNAGRIEAAVEAP